MLLRSVLFRRFEDAPDHLWRRWRRWPTYSEHKYKTYCDMRMTTNFIPFLSNNGMTRYGDADCTDKGLGTYGLNTGSVHDGIKTVKKASMQYAEQRICRLFSRIPLGFRPCSISLETVVLSQFVVAFGPMVKTSLMFSWRVRGVITPSSFLVHQPIRAFTFSPRQRRNTKNPRQYMFPG